MKRVLGIVVGLLVVGLGVWLYFKLFPGNETLIRRKLLDVERFASFSGDEKPLSRLGNVNQLAGCFSSDVVLRINVSGNGRSLEGRDALTQAAMGVRNTMSSLKVEFVNPAIDVADDKENATVQTALKVTPSDGEIQTLELKLSLRKVEGRWFIYRLESAGQSSFRTFTP